MIDWVVDLVECVVVVDVVEDDMFVLFVYIKCIVCIVWWIIVLCNVVCLLCDVGGVLYQYLVIFVVVQVIEVICDQGEKVLVFVCYWVLMDVLVYLFNVCCLLCVFDVGLLWL